MFSCLKSLLYILLHREGLVQTEVVSTVSDFCANTYWEFFSKVSHKCFIIQRLICNILFRLLFFVFLANYGFNKNEMTLFWDRKLRIIIIAIIIIDTYYYYLLLFFITINHYYLLIIVT